MKNCLTLSDLALNYIFHDSSPPANILLTSGLPEGLRKVLEGAGHEVQETDRTCPHEWPTRQFDWIVISDILLDATNAVACLSDASQRLAPSGRLVAMVANARHVSNRIEALSGRLAEQGSLTRPPRRVFTKDLLLEAARLAGLHAHKLQASRSNDGATMDSPLAPAALKRTLKEIGRDDTLDEDSYVMEMRLAPEDRRFPEIQSGPRSLRILALTDVVDSGIARIRLRLPLEAFGERGCRHIRYEAFGLVNSDLLNWADVVVIQRGACGHAQQAAEWCMTKGKPYVYEIDDLLIELPPFMSHHVGYIKNKPLMEDMIRGATAVTVTNVHLKSALSHLNSKIWICPNFHIPRRRPIKQPTVQNSAPVHLLIAHTDKILLDFFTPALIRAHQNLGARIQIVAIGPIGEMLAAAGIPCKQLPLIALDEFIPVLSAMPNPVTMIPLDDSKFSNCKSAIKFFDYAQGGIATICSNVSPYRDVVTHEQTGLLAENTVEAWLSCIERLVEHPAERVRLASQAQRMVLSQHDLRQAAFAWQMVFNEVAPNDVAIQLPPRTPRKKSGYKQLREYLQKKNQQRKARRRLIKATLAARTPGAEQ